MLGLFFSIPRQGIILGKRLRNDVLCVEWDVKPQLSQCVRVCASTKQMIVEVVRCQKSGDNLVQILRQPVTHDEVETDVECLCYTSVCLITHLSSRDMRSMPEMHFT